MSRGLSRVEFDDAVLARGQAFEVGPGNGVSISIGVCVYSETARRDARVHQLNRVLRRLRLAPTSPGESVWRDAVEAPLGCTLANLAARFRGYDAPPGAY